MQHTMIHRHISTQDFTLAAIDDIIDRGQLKDWLELRDAIQEDPRLADAVLHICRHHREDENIRYDFWPVFLNRKGENFPSDEYGV